LRHAACHLQSSPPHLLAPPREAAPRSSLTSYHFLLPRGRLPNGSPLRPPSEHSVTATSFDLSSRCSLTTSLSPFTNGLPHHRRSRATRVAPPWTAAAGEPPTTPPPHIQLPAPPLSSWPPLRLPSLPAWPEWPGRHRRHRGGALPCSSWASRSNGPTAKAAQENSGVGWAKSWPHEQCHLSFS
jgi:hypothetical protein